MTLGLTNGTDNIGFSWYKGASFTYTFSKNSYGTNIGTTYSESLPTNGKDIGITTDETKSGIISKRINTDSHKYLEFYLN